MLFYMIFGTNLEPSASFCFFLDFEFYRKGIQNGVQMTWKFTVIFYGPEEAPEAKELGQKSPEPTTRVERAPHGARPLTLWLPQGPPDLFLTPTPLIYIQTSRKKPRSGVLPPQASVATKNQSRPCSGTLPEGGTLTGGHLHHPGALHDEEGVVHPRGWGYVPVAMCLIFLSLSLSLVFLIRHDLDVPRAFLL